jgi:hypothetical protein
MGTRQYAPWSTVWLVKPSQYVASLTKVPLACAISTSYPSIVALLASGVVQVILTYSFSMLVTGALAGADGAVAAYTAA